MAVSLIGGQDWQNFPVSKKQVTETIILFKTGVTDASPNMLAVKTSQGVVVVDSLQLDHARRLEEGGRSMADHFLRGYRKRELGRWG